MKIVKKLGALLMVCLLAFSLAGCVRFSTDITIKSNGNADLNIMVATIDADYEGIETSNEMSEESQAEMQKAGWTYEKYEQDNFVGYVLHKSNMPLKDLGQNISQVFEQDEQSALVITNSGSTYHLQWNTKSMVDDVKDIMALITQNGGYMRVSITLPTKPIEHNATSVSEDGKTLTWDLIQLKDEQIDVTFKLKESILPWIIGCAAALMFVVLILVLILRKKKPVEDETVVNTQPVDVPVEEVAETVPIEETNEEEKSDE